jgi:predicted metalloprotease
MPGGGARRASGGISFGTIILLVVIFFGLRACGIDPLALLAGGGQGGYPDQGGYSQNQSTPTKDITDEQGQFLSVVLAETEDVWNGILREQGIDYPEPQMVLFSNAVRSACGNASAASGPFYCPADQDIYLDTSFFRTLSQRFGASGDFAQAYVIAHEVGHHVQQVIGILPKFNQMRSRMSQVDQNAMSVRVELQADCLAGVWAHYTDQKGLLEAGDLDEALNAAQQIGDDTIQKRTQGYVVPESFNHGTSEQRRTWFYRGYESGKLAACDTKVFG